MVRTRFAPSPTGYMHIGNLRTALYAWLIARHNNGKFILRIEDTDQARLVSNSIEVIYRTLSDCGLSYDEGPDIGGPVGPYIQSERKSIYLKYAEFLLQENKAYKCYCDTKHDPCRYLINTPVDRPYVIRQKIPENCQISFTDEVFGTITVNSQELDDQILIKQNGLPTYNFANVIDDHLMGITHVVRGSEYLSSCPKYNLLYESFGWDPPIYIHCPPVMMPNGKKMSKRNGDPSYEDLIEQGYLGEAVINYIALCGWAPKSNKEIFSLSDLVASFDITGIQKSPSVFDIKKLDYFNSIYIRNIDISRYIPGPKSREIAKLVKPRIKKLSDIQSQIDFFEKLPDYDVKLFINRRSKSDLQSSATVLSSAYLLQELSVEKLSKVLNMSIGSVAWPIRIALSGKTITPGGTTELIEILGKEEAFKRILIGLQKIKLL